jgi:hypothetical protein
VQPAPTQDLPKLNAIAPRLYGPSTALANERAVRVISWDLVGNTAIDTGRVLLGRTQRSDPMIYLVVAAICAVAGSTNTGSVDLVEDLAALAAREP